MSSMPPSDREDDKILVGNMRLSTLGKWRLDCDSQKRMVLKLRNELDRQLKVLQRIIDKQIQLTGQDPTSKNEAAAKTVEKATASGES